MPIYRQQAGLFNVGSYQVSGYAYLTGSAVDGSSPSNGEVRIQFPTVAKNITVINTSTANIGLRVYFNASTASNGANGAGAYPDGAPVTGHHYITLENKKDSVTFDVKCQEIFVALTGSGGAGSYECWAELTGINNNEMFLLTGSGLTD
jgi:hypothetical protein